MRVTDCKMIVDNVSILIDDIEQAIFISVETHAERVKMEDFFEKTNVAFSIHDEQKVKVLRTA